MPIVPNPKYQKWQTISLGHYAGDIHESWNIDLKRDVGRVTTPKRFWINTDSTDLSGSMGVPLAFVNSDADHTTRFWALTTTKMVKTGSNSATAAYANDALANSPTDPQDLVLHEMNNGNTRMVVSRSTDIAILNSSGSNNIWTASWWQSTLGQAALSSSGLSGQAVNHPMERLERLIAICDNNLVHTIDKDDVVANSRLSLNPVYQLIAVYVSLDRFWFVAQNGLSGKGIVAEWDGSLQSFNQIYTVEGNPIFGFIAKDVMHVVFADGSINKFNGRGFEPFVYFPVYEEQILLTAPLTHRCSSIDGNLVHMNVLPATNSSRMRGGVWTLDLETNNLYHQASFGQYKASVGTDTDFGQSVYSKIGGIYNTYLAGQFLAGAEVYSDYVAGTPLRAIYMLVDAAHRISFTTGLIPSSQVEDHWYNIWVRFKKFLRSTDKIVTKYRVLDQEITSDSNDPPQCNITWTSSTTFTGAIPTGVAVGDEVEVRSGDNAGCTFHITTLSGTPDGSTTRTVTIDETSPITSAKGAFARFDNWVKISNNNPITPSANSNIKTMNQTVGSPSVASGPYIQFKFELRGFKVGLDQIKVDQEVQTGTQL